MTAITLKGSPIHTNGKLPAVGSQAPDFLLISTDLKPMSLKDYSGKKLILAIVPSLDTGVCLTSAKQFEAEAAVNLRECDPSFTTVVSSAILPPADCLDQSANVSNPSNKVPALIV